ncbi:Phosphatidylinositol-glycan biosynthesis class X protein [Dirofilaria immitis]
MIVRIFLSLAACGLVFCQHCDWIDAITIRKANIKVLFYKLYINNIKLWISNRFVDCLIAYKFVIPAGAYIDFDSLKEYPTHTYGKALFDVEAPKEKSKNTPFYICSKRRLRKIFVHKQLFELPIHLRYHAATGKDAIIVVPAPQLLLRCMENSTFLTSHCKKYLVKAPCDCSVESHCEWLMIPFLEDNPVQFKIPTGNVSSLKFVLFITVFVVICCTIAIIIATMKNVVKVEKVE